MPSQQKRRQRRQLSQSLKAEHQSALDDVEGCSEHDIGAGSALTQPIISNTYPSQCRPPASQKATSLTEEDPGADDFEGGGNKSAAGDAHEGDTVLVHGMQSQQHLNGLRGRVVGHDGQQVRVDFGPPHGTVAVSLEYVSEATGPTLKGAKAFATLAAPFKCASLPVDCRLEVPAGDCSCGSVCIDSACQIRGIETNGAPKSCIRGQFVIDMREPSDVVTMANLKMHMPHPGNTIWCKRGTLHIKNCTISSAGVGIGVGGDKHGSNVTVRDCRIEHCGQGGVVVSGEGSTATLVGCRLSSNRAGGLELREGSSTRVEDSTFQANGNQAIVSWCKAQHVSVARCVFRDHPEDSTILIADRSSADIEECTISSSRMAAIAVENASASICNCDCQDNLQGLLVQTGRCTVSVERCTFRNNRQHGVFIGYDAVGHISIIGCMLVENSRRGLEDCSRHKVCAVELEANVVHSNGDDGCDAKYKIAKKLAKHQPLSDEVCDAVREEFFRSEEQRTGQGRLAGADALEGMSKVRTAKARKEAGLKHGLPHCEGCGKTEPDGNTFSKCSECRSVLYCSRECQKKHWKAHKPNCKKLAKYPKFCDPSTSVIESSLPEIGGKEAQLQFRFGQCVKIRGTEDDTTNNEGRVVGLRAGADCDHVRVDFGQRGCRNCKSEQLSIIDCEIPATIIPCTSDWQCIEFAPSLGRPWKFFVGQVAGGWPHGKGLLVFHDGGMHVGEFVNKDAVGAGMHYYPLFMPKNVLGNWKYNKPHSAVLQWKGASVNLCRFKDGSAYGVGLSDGELLSFNSRPPMPIALKEGCPSLLKAMKTEVLAAAEVVQEVLRHSGFFAYQYTSQAMDLLEKALAELDSQVPH